MKKWLIPVVLTLILAGIYYPVINKYSLSFKFVDEDEYIVNGWLMGQGYKLYRDISTNHQPVTYIVSQLIHQVTHPDNDYMLIRRHRQAVYLWCMAWWFILMWRFGKRAVIPIVIFENIKYLTLGNEFVAEALVAYPMVYVFMSTVQLTFNKIRRKEDFFLGFTTIAIPYLLLPLAIPAAILMGWRYFILKAKGLPIFLGGAGLLFIILCFFINPIDHIRETVVFNYLYAMPRLSPIQDKFDYGRMFLLPFFYLTQTRDILGKWGVWILSGWIFCFAYLIFKRQKRQVIKLIGIFLVWQLTNLRVVNPGVYFYEAFHLTPWFIVGIASSVYLWQFSLSQIKSRLRWAVVAVVSISGIVLWLSPGMPYRTRVDPQTEHYVQFTPINQASQVINTLKKPDDKLMVLPNEVLIHWNTRLKPATRQVTYYEWQYYPARSNREYHEMLDTNPPTFIVFDNEGSVFVPSVQKLLADSYWQIFKRPNVYIKKTTIDELTDEQRQKFIELPFEDHQIVPLPGQ